VEGLSSDVSPQAVDTEELSTRILAVPAADGGGPAVVPALVALLTVDCKGQAPPVTVRSYPCQLCCPVS
jgi:hypothetical protein